MLLYLTALRAVALSMTHLFSSRHVAAALTGLIVTSMALVSSYIVHPDDVGDWASWLRFASPQWWLDHPVLQDEFNPVRNFRCTANPVVTTDIIKQVPCGLSDGNKTIEYFDFLPKFDLSSQTSSSTNSQSWWFSAKAVPILISVLFYILFQLLDVVFYLGQRQVAKKSRAKLHKME